MPTLNKIEQTLRAAIHPIHNSASAFCKTGPGDYAEFDKFLGVRMPPLRQIAKSYEDLPFETLELLLQSQFNEERLLALLILILQYKKASVTQRECIFQFYLQNIRSVNNWNLVDASAYQILGTHLESKDRTILIDFAQSENLWARRIAIVATFHFIRKLDFIYTIKITQMMLNDTQDLIRKACGWMLKEMGKRDQGALINFLDQHHNAMPRTMLRYAIEKLSDDMRRQYLQK